MPLPCLYEFFGVVTSPRVYPAAPTPPAIALDQIVAWTESPTVAAARRDLPASAHPESVGGSSGLAGPAVHDAKIAAICLDHGVRALLTMDRDFSRFPALTTRSLLA